MRHFTTSSLMAKPGEVFKAADEGGAVLTRHGRPSFVLLPVDRYQFLESLSRARPRKASGKSEGAPEGAP